MSITYSFNKFFLYFSSFDDCVVVGKGSLFLLVLFFVFRCKIRSDFVLNGEEYYEGSCDFKMLCFVNFSLCSFSAQAGNKRI